MITNDYKGLTRELVKRIGLLEKWKRDKTGDSPLFDIANENTPAALTEDQNNYDPGYYDVLRLDATGDVTITGIAKGKKGRFLELYNISSRVITLARNHPSSNAANRIVNPTDGDILLFSNARAALYYDATIQKWVVPDMPSWKGAYGISAAVSTGSQSIADDGNAHKLSVTLATADQYSLFDSANYRFVLPTGMNGMWVGEFHAYWDPHATGGNERFIGMNVNGFARSGLTVPSVANTSQWQTLAIGEILNQGDILEFYARQVSGGALDIRSVFIYLAKI